MGRREDLIERSIAIGKQGTAYASSVLRSGLLKQGKPSALKAAKHASDAWGATPAASIALSAERHPHDEAIIDERGSLTFSELHNRTNQLAHAFLAAGVKSGDNIAILCRNHRGFIESHVAALKIGAHSIFLNTAFAGPQLQAVIEDHNATVVVYDEEYTEMLGDVLNDRSCYVGWVESDSPQHQTLEQAIVGKSIASPSAPPEPGHSVILTSGTTGKPKGAKRSAPKGAGQALGVLTKIPYHYRQQALIAAPLFHAWGYGNFASGGLFSSTYILRRYVDPVDIIQTIDDEKVTLLVVVPVMLQRLLEVDPAVLDTADTSSLKVVVCSGSALSGDLAHRFMDRFGDVVYNLYGSTEVAWATIAQPIDMREAPGTAGRAPVGTTLKIISDDGKELAPGETGRVFVKHKMVFEGYTGNEQGMLHEDMVGTGDLGHIDRNGRLFIDGRIDEMIISGGENVYPIEVEEALANHEAVTDCAVIGVEDEEFGERLKAFVVITSGFETTEKDLKDFVRQTLARYKVPREIVFMEELPRNATGKILKRELQQLQAS